MRLHRLQENHRGDMVRSEIDGSHTRGDLFVDEQGVVRWVPIEQQIREGWQGHGRYSGADGYSVFDAPSPVEPARF